ncbi:MAG: hypothetical protein M3O70_08775 [Actinomycetota bacterium]|nr:hypothetical protein [Actinomycetota bacterium]
MSDTRLGGCGAARWRFAVVGGCCDSCHDDESHGPQLFQIPIAGEGWYEVCCEVAEDVVDCDDCREAIRAGRDPDHAS